MSGTQMASFLDIPFPSYSKYEQNERFPEPKRFVDIANRLGVSTDFLLGNSQYLERVEDYIKIHSVSNGEITPEDIESLGLKGNNVVLRLLTLPDLLLNKGAERELDRLNLDVGRQSLIETREQLDNNPNPETQKKYDRCLNYINSLEESLTKKNMELDSLQKEYQVLMKLIDLSISKPQEAPPPNAPTNEQ